MFINVCNEKMEVAFLQINMVLLTLDLIYYVLFCVILVFLNCSMHAIKKMQIRCWIRRAEETIADVGANCFESSITTT